MSIQDYIDTLNIDYKAEFVPCEDLDNPYIHWKITLSVDKGPSLTTPYRQGVGHLPEFSHNHYRSVDGKNNVEQAITTGRWRGMYRDRPLTKLVSPQLIDVMFALTIDSAALDYTTFEDWASEFGYDSDSRKAEVIYNECIRIGLWLIRNLGQNTLVKLTNLYWDY